MSTKELDVGGLNELFGMEDCDSLIDSLVEEENEGLNAKQEKGFDEESCMDAPEAIDLPKNAPPSVPNKTTNINIDNMYLKLDKLVDSGNRLLKGVEYLIDTSADGEQINGAAQLINSISGVVKEFTKINILNIKHQQNMDLENLKHANKLKLANAKINTGAIDIDTIGDEDIDANSDIPVQKIAYKQEDIMDMVLSKVNNK